MADSRYAGEAGLQAVFGQIKAAMAEKQDKINDMGLSHNDYSNEEKQKNAQNASDIVELNSDIDNIIEKMDGDATVYPYADVITINDAIPANVADCNVKIEPVQDLHGYDHPWVGGAGKNKQILTVDEIISGNGGQSAWSNNTRTINDVVYTILTDDSNNVIGIKLNGTANASTLFEFPLVDLDGRYTVNGCPTGGGVQSYRLDLRAYDGGVMLTDTGSGATSGNIRISARCIIRIESGTVCDNIVFRPMIRLSTEQDATFAPYTNICPISGHTEASVQRDGKNLFDKNNAGNLTGRALNSETGEPYVTSGWMTSSFIKIDPSTTYTLITTSASSSVAFYDSAKAYISGAASFGTKTTPSNAKYLRFDYKTENADIMQLELGSTATTYEPYAGKTYTIALGDTIYGGTVDFDSGVMTVDRAIDTIKVTGIRDTYTNINYALLTKPNGSAEKGNYDYFDTITNKYEVASASSDWDNTNKIGKMFMQANGNDYWIGFPKGTTQADMYNTVGDLSVCYELATPTTVNLTPQQIQLLKGQNTLTASTGQISVTVNGVSGAIGELTTDKQDKTDYALETTAKTVVGGINELKSDLTNKIEGIFVPVTTDDGRYCTITFSNINVTRRTVFAILIGSALADTKLALCKAYADNNAPAISSDDQSVTFDVSTMTLTIDVGTNAWTRALIIAPSGLFTVAS